MSHYGLKIRVVFAAILLSGFVSLQAFAVSVETLRVATWNTHDLFESTPNGVPDIADSVNFTPSSWRRWTEARYQSQITNLATVISVMKPDILFVQEVAGSNVLHHLTHVLRTLPEGAIDYPYIAHRKSPDRRGIDVALISRYPIKSYDLKIPVSGMRGALVVQIDVDETDVYGIVNHWKSWVGDEKSNVAIRMKEAQGVRKEALAILTEKPDATLFIAGDFNDNLDGDSLVKGLKAFPTRDAVSQVTDDTVFYNVLGELPKDKLGSYYYARRRVWNTFDAILVTQQMLLPIDSPGPAWRLPPSGKTTVETFRYPAMVGPDGRPMPSQRTRIGGTDEYVLGYSDHFPVYADFIRGNVVKK